MTDRLNRLSGIAGMAMSNCPSSIMSEPSARLLSRADFMARSLIRSDRDVKMVAGVKKDANVTRHASLPYTDIGDS
jgi:hypothetical protein